ncbi:MAG: two-component system sensor histidine kinase RegB [Pirellulaceae bacterium]|jgi:two-component system sensor histidine kinase RegB
MNAFPPPRVAVDFSDAHRLAVNASWLLRLRWVAVVGQLLTIGVARCLIGDSIFVLPLLSIVAFTAITNLILLPLSRPLRIEEKVSNYTRLRLAAVMLLDLLLLTGLLFFAGGPANPFALFYLVNLALAAVVLPARMSWVLALVAALCFAVLHLKFQPIPGLGNIYANSSNSNWGGITLQHEGFSVALIASATVIVYFFTRISGELRQRENELRVAEQQQARNERLQALATLAAGAGHELATPLSTIAVVANELERHLNDSDAPNELLDDVRLIRTELASCRTILNRMSTDAGQAAGDELTDLTIQSIVDESVQGLRKIGNIEVNVSSEAQAVTVRAPLQGLAQAIRGVLQNAFDASQSGQSVKLTAEVLDNRVHLTVVDRGEGMPPEVLARVGEPFFTTKEVGQGTGLGLFLTRTVIERLGGNVEVQSSEGEGTAVDIQLPIIA